MTLEDALKVKKGDHLWYNTVDDHGKDIKVEMVVKSIWGDPNKFACDAAVWPNEYEITNAFSPIACFDFMD